MPSVYKLPKNDIESFIDNLMHVSSINCCDSEKRELFLDVITDLEFVYQRVRKLAGNRGVSITEMTEEEYDLINKTQYQKYGKYEKKPS